MKRELTAAFVCLRCRKVFKRPSHRLVRDAYQVLNQKHACPDCKQDMVEVGDAFRAPRANDRAAWKRVEQDIQKGRKYFRDEDFGMRQERRKRLQAEKGVRSIFQLPGRKRPRETN